MEIPDISLEKLKCDVCSNYLSCGPIFYNYATFKVICGRCSPNERSVKTIRYHHYEVAANLLLFPCINAMYGCPRKLNFSSEGPHTHESTCNYEKLMCPMNSGQITLTSCKWLGGWPEFLQHCKSEHPDKILQNPCTFRHDYALPMLETYLITAYNSIFLLNVKISDKIYHCVRIIGDPPKSNLFKYSLEINASETSKFIKEGQVFPLDNPDDVNTAIILNVGDVMGIFDGATVANFILTLHQKQTTKLTEIFETLCKFCFKIVQQGDTCDECNLKLRYCHFNKKGCLFFDIYSEKCYKHEIYFCKFLNECADCGANVDIDMLFQHYVMNHNAIKANVGEKWHILEDHKQFCILTSANNVFFCKFSLAYSRLLLSIFTPFSSDELKNYKCLINILDPKGAYTTDITPQIEYDYQNDWTINVNMFNYPMWQKIGLDIIVKINEI